MRWVIFGVLFVVTIILAIFSAGAMLPLSHVASRKLKLNQPPEADALGAEDSVTMRRFYTEEPCVPDTADGSIITKV